ncbi:iron chaperone [Croceimicrobium hydrocarbonivorans]|nr:DUF1801 domain-containing protein [Croceimicrobium hydrocarbonivorans]
MAKMKQYNQVADYLADQSEECRDKLLELRACILEAAPQAVEKINYNIPVFALEEGAKMDKQIMMAGYKKHVSLYPHPDTIEAFKDQLQEAIVKKGTLQFPLNKPLPKDLIIAMVKYRIQALGMA